MKDLYVLGGLLALVIVCATALALVGVPVPDELKFTCAGLVGAVTGSALPRRKEMP